MKYLKNEDENEEDIKKTLDQSLKESKKIKKDFNIFKPLHF